jgi:hypothetical protein
VSKKEFKGTRKVEERQAQEGEWREVFKGKDTLRFPIIHEWDPFRREVRLFQTIRSGRIMWRLAIKSLGTLWFISLEVLQELSHELMESQSNLNHWL